MNETRAIGVLAVDDNAAVPAPTPLYAAPAGLARPFTVLLVLPDRMPAWLATFLELASATGWMQVCVLPVSGVVLPRVRDVPVGIRAFLACERTLRRVASPTLSAVTLDVPEGVVLSPWVPSSIDPQRLKQQVQALQADLVVSLGPPEWIDLLVDCAPWGCWNLDANLVDPHGAGIALLAPLLKGSSATELVLELQTQAPAPIGLAASCGATQRGSFNQQRERSFLKLPLLLLRSLHRLATGDLEMPRRCAAQLRQARAASPLGFAAGTRAFATTLYSTASWRLGKQRSRAMPWLLVLRRDSTPLDPDAPEVRTSSVIQAPVGNFWADPCMVVAAGRQLVFVEEMTASGKGTIACLELHSGAAARLGIALEEPCHLSYPQVFLSDAQWYMTVESSRLQRVSLYRSSTFPLGWERVADLITGRVCADPTLHFHDGHWFLFATVAENRNSTWDELFLFVSEQLTGPFRPHPGNPILSDVRCARPAGRLFHHRGRLIRPAQDCASNYGSAIVFHEVLELTPTSYRERRLSRLTPDWSDSLVACHTYSAAGGMEMLDAKGHLPAAVARMALVEQIPRLAGVAAHADQDQEPTGVQIPLGESAHGA